MFNRDFNPSLPPHSRAREGGKKGELEKGGERERERGRVKGGGSGREGKKSGKRVVEEGWRKRGVEKKGGGLKRKE